MAENFDFGVEEEYFIVQRHDGSTKTSMSSLFFESARETLGSSVTRELLQSQIEVATSPCQSMNEARRQLQAFRETLGDIGARYGLGIVAAGTHPTAVWSEQRATEHRRYDRVAHDLQMIAHRKMICGMHVHVAVPEWVSRVDLMVRMLPFVPLLLALSTSSPFWQSRRTGLMCYRQALYAELPRSGLPDLFRDEEDYTAYVAALVDNRIIADASSIWWAVRPSSQYPTLELRVADSCTHLEDVLAIAALYRCLVRRLCLDPRVGAGLSAANRGIIEENKWRAQRYGCHGSLIDVGSGEAVSVANALHEVLDLVAGDAEVLDCVAEIEAARGIPERGTSADGQLALYSASLSQGNPPGVALQNVLNWLAETTMQRSLARHDCAA